ncbi:MAG: hypothetical protein BGP06_05430 [Rhizobiales bacterium 65-9]|nr:FAD-binding protein [Hyphomicrobiales bacterium]OJY35323.1 MAG: hypothetical protein BGP06_05430 [Rhizobiales bacterium 65-9]
MTDAFDVIVVGFGYAGGVAAIEAHDAGARVLILEKRADAGGVSVCSAGGVRYTRDAASALAYLEATNAGTTPTPVLKALADGMATMPDYITKLAEDCGASAVARQASANYPFAGYDSFGFVNIDDAPGFDAARDFPAVRGSAPGARLFKVVLENVRRRSIEVRYAARAERLIVEEGLVAGVVVNGEAILARGGVVLCAGGFEGSAELQAQFWPIKPVLSAAIRTNTGDGLRMAQAAGAALWHLWHYHGSYGFRHPDPDYPFGVRLKRLPDWTPGQPFREDAPMSWILVNREGRRFMNEYEPYMQDTGHRAFEAMDFARMAPANAPAVLIVDANGRERYALSAPTWHDEETARKFASVSPRDMDGAILRAFDSLEELADAFEIDAASLLQTVSEWNAGIEAEVPDRLGRPDRSRMPIVAPPFSAALTHPIVSNTQGGPVHDERQRVLDAFGAPIPHLWEAGEIGSVFGHIYMSGGNLAECFVGGGVAGREAAANAKNVRAAS